MEYGFDDVDLAEFAGAQEESIVKVSLGDVQRLDNSWTTPLIIESSSQSSDFHRFPRSPAGIPDFLIQHFGGSTVPVRKAGETRDVVLRDWATGVTVISKINGWYLKDWHVNQTCRGLEIQPLFETPAYFPDWLNQFNETTNGIHKLDFQFLYWGCAGTVTPCHQDVMGTFSWSHNLCGRKRWKFFCRQPGDVPVVITCMQSAGETVFVPSGCRHIVENVDETISINQNWFNANNLLEVANQLVADCVQAEGELEAFGVEFQSREEQAQRVALLVKSNNSLNIDILASIMKLHSSQSSATDRLAIAAVTTMLLREQKHLTSECAQLLFTMNPS